MNIDLIALDLDDTLLREDLSVSPANRAALASAEEHGVRIVLASGRNIQSMLGFADSLGMTRPGDCLICSNGAETIEPATRKVLDRRVHSPGLCQEIAAALKAEGFPWQVYEDGVIYVSEPNAWAERDTKLNGQPTVPISDTDAFLTKARVKFVVPGEPSRIAELLPRLQARLGGSAEIFTSKPYFLELLPKGATKGSALVRLAAALGFPMRRVMAIGDAMNDLAMIRAAGWGCAPANAVPEVAAAARYVSPRTNEEDAVADIIGTLVLGT